jgi:hypothetical protein
MPEVPNTRFINFVDTPANVTYGASGGAQVNLDPQTGGVIDLTGFRRINLLIGSTTATSFEVFIGKISGSTLSQGNTQPIDNKVHTFEVVGPQMTLWLIGGRPNKNEKVQLWVYLRS